MRSGATFALRSAVLMGSVAWGAAVLPLARAQEGDDRVGGSGGGEGEGAGGVDVEVVEVAGGRVYVAPGRGQGVRPGAIVRLGGRAHSVAAATDGYAVLEMAPPFPPLGTIGRAEPTSGAGDDDDPAPLPDPRPLDAFAHQWTDPVLPAATQEVDVVSLGGTGPRDARYRVDVFAGGYAAVSLGDGRGPGIGGGEVRGRVHAEPWAGVPFALEVDAAARFWLAPDLGQRAGGSSRPNVYVRELALRYGDVDRFSVAGGRLRYAASLLGPIDGARVEAPRLGGVTVAAFGGGVPDPQSGVPSFEASRFGVEASYRDETSPWRPSATLVAHGSVYDGRIDERRLAASVQLFPDQGRLGAHAELSLHDGDNPWGVSPVELSAAGVEGGIRVDDFDVGARFDLRRPERSRWLAAHLPPGYLCAVEQAQGDGAGPCVDGDDGRYLGSVDVGQRLTRDVRLRAGGQVIHYPVDPDLSQFGGYAEVVATGYGGRVQGTVRGESWASTLVERHGGRLGGVWTLVPGMVDVGARYRLYVQRYRAELDPTLEHAVGVEVLLRPLPSLDLSVDADVYTGADVDLLLVQLLAAWRL